MKISKAFRTGLAGATLLALSAVAAQAQSVSRENIGEAYVPTIWTDPDGCEHWVMDDGIEGYLSQRLDKYGKPVCSGAAPPNTAIGPYKSGSIIFDPI